MIAFSVCYIIKYKKLSLYSLELQIYVLFCLTMPKLLQGECLPKLKELIILL